MSSNIPNQLTESEIQSLINNDSSYAGLKAEVQRNLTSLFENESFNNSEAAIQERLYNMINYAIGRFDYYSEQKHKFLNLGLSFIGVSATFLGILLSNSNSIPDFLKLCGYINSIVLFITGIIMLIIYNNYMTANYPYRKIMDIHSWYFKYKFSDKLDYRLSKKKKKADKQLLEVTKSYMSSVYNWTNKSKTKNYFLKEDIEQVAILQLLQKYSRDCVNKMKKTMNWGIAIFISVPVLILIKDLLLLLIDYLQKK
ncbi:hypothetical protein [Saccharicrinis fermentans]|uniref:Uncharacterized protein n=1 Tax=Saccharicrinis fermentans DSM 9555 = JCM 21142 TaxID=869213 RepID=W7YMS0_9BACT|nr:hypothetical protein [Saccharicrinis fermentans]GAF05971.1 hypothetical protein JCM21142_134736 [Saccharicrinis fermentans DSM 9555 = JCM 21142]